MHLAARGQLEVIKFLAPKFGIRVHDKCDSLYTALHWAAQLDHGEVVRYLIEDLNMDPQDRDKVCGVAGKWKICYKVQICKCVCHLDVRMYNAVTGGGLCCSLGTYSLYILPTSH